MKYFRPASVLDIGCGTGAWLSEWKKAGVSSVTGVDGDYVNSSQLLISKNEFFPWDLEKPYRNNTHFDLVTSLEVAEHIEPAHARAFILTLCSHADLILFSAAIPGQEGTKHVNEQFPSYWVQLFEENGFAPVDCLRMQLWENENISWWYRQNIMFFVKRTSVKNYPQIEQCLVKQVMPVPSLVHPEIFKHKSNKAAYYEYLSGRPFSWIRYRLEKIFSRTDKNVKE
ncbi:MAG TPA: methyltransferase domain-containing protein [Bacteroidia bacterium]|nr:methyltransferase domain-containing protein [Bacteroidia bacterium]